MNLIKISSFKRAQIILRINSFLLFIFIIATPYLIKRGVWGVPEYAIESIFLAIEIGILIKLFKAYDFHSNENDRKADKLSGELEEQKKLSAGTFEYLGKVNVQMSIIKQLVKKFKAPADKNRLENVIREMLQIIAGLTENDDISLRIIDLNNYSTIEEIFLKDDNKQRKKITQIDNKFLCKKGQIDNNKDIQVIFSEHDNFSLKTYIFVDNLKSDQIDDEQLELIQDITNQCEITYLLFKSQYYK